MTKWRQDMKPTNLLEEAANRIYDFGHRDASDVVAQLNLQYGLGKIIWALKKRKIDTQSTLAVTTPDSGITRNKERWQAGFSYGCLLRWPSEEEAGRAFAFPELKPNACGMLVAKINNIPSLQNLSDGLHQIEKNGLRIKESKLKLNVGVSNHFIEICRVSESSNPALNVNDIVAVIHTSPSEFKSTLYDFNMWKNKGGVWEDTPLGPLLVMEGQAANEYLSTYRDIEAFSLQKRLVLAKHLFNDFQVISNSTHQGLFNDNEARLGLYRFEHDNELLPVTFRWDINVYLMSPQVNLAEEFIGQKNSSDKITSILKDLNMLPHGGGYELPFLPEGWRVMQNGSKRLFAYKNAGTEFVFSSPSEIPYHYRGLQVIDKIEALKLGKVAAKLKQVYTLKY